VEDFNSLNDSNSLSKFLKRNKLIFFNRHLLKKAFTHRSYLNEHSEILEDNERLEFLGDAVLDFLVGAWLYNHFPEMTEGELTRFRSALVRTDQLADFARQIHLGELIYLGKGEEENGGREKNTLLCASFEALIGALFLDSGIEAVESFINPLLKQAVDTILLTQKENDPKSLFQEWAQAKGLGVPMYKVVSSKGPDHERTFEVEVWLENKLYGRGLGRSKRAATIVAARKAVETLNLG